MKKRVSTDLVRGGGPVLSFQQGVLQVVQGIPKGSVLAYKQVAEMAGSPGAFRAVGSLLAKNENMQIPCHRVIRSDGGLGEYNGLQGKTKRELLLEEGAIQ